MQPSICWLNAQLRHGSFFTSPHTEEERGYLFCVKRAQAATMITFVFDRIHDAFDYTLYPESTRAVDR